MQRIYACVTPARVLPSLIGSRPISHRLNGHYLALARDLDVMEPKSPEDIYKAHLVEGRTPTGPALDSARQNLASTFVNGLVNAGFGVDKLVTAGSELGGSEVIFFQSTSLYLCCLGEPTMVWHHLFGKCAWILVGITKVHPMQVHWIFKNKDQGKLAATASLGLVTMWDAEGGLPLIDKYMYSKDPHIVAGALLGVGITCSGVQHDNDPAYVLLYDSVDKADPTIAISAILGLGLAYVGAQRVRLCCCHTHVLHCTAGLAEDHVLPYKGMLVAKQDWYWSGQDDICSTCVHFQAML